MNMFRTLRADEIDCRISQIKEKDGKPSGLSLLLYKDARCDQNILDETVGPMNWERRHSRENANCTVSIWCEERKCWVSKEDTGTESNTEREKGLASDSFKRSCFNWGIGRELYTAPFIWIPADKCEIRKDSRGKFVCYDRFTVHGIGYKDGVITGLEIKNQKTGKICYKFGEINETAPEKPEQTDNEPNEEPGVEFPRQSANATVSNIQQMPPKNPVLEYIANEISFMKQMFGIAETAEMNKKFMEMRKSLIEADVIEDIPSDKQTMEQAKNMMDAIYKTFMTDKKDAG